MRSHEILKEHINTQLPIEN